MGRVWITCCLLPLLLFVAVMRCESGEDLTEAATSLREKRQMPQRPGANWGTSPAGHWGSSSGWGGGGGWDWDSGEWEWGAQGGWYKDKCKPKKPCTLRCWQLPPNNPPASCLSFCLKHKECFCRY